MTGRAWQWLLWSALGLAMAGTAYLLVFTTFMFYDDEGYVLLTLRDYLAGGRLYDEIFTQYGPWPYLYHQIVTGVTQLPLTHTLGRYLTVLHWVAAAGFCGAVAARLTGRTVAAVVATLTSFGLLWQMLSEPSHPGSLICLVAGLAVLLATGLPGARRPMVLAAACGALAAGLFLTKINVGLLFIAGAGCAALRFTSLPGRWQRPAGIAGSLGLVALPWLLMAGKIADPWVLVFAVQFSLGGAGLLWVTPASWTDRSFSPRQWGAAVTGFGLTTVIVCGIVCWHGTSLGALLQVVLVNPLRHPTNFMIGFTWIPSVWPVAIIAWLLTARAGWELRRHGGVSPGMRGGIISVRLAGLLIFGIHAIDWLTIFGVGRFIVFCLPLLPLFVVPLTSREKVEPPRLLTGWLAAFLAMPQVLHSYPIAGSQMGWGTFLLVPLFVAGLHETWRSPAGWLPRGRCWITGAGWAALLAVNGWQLWLLGSNGWDRYRTSRPLDLPGAKDIRIPGPARLAARTLTLNANVHADVLFSRPGMFSYNLWSGVPTPTSQNATHWFWLLDEGAQRRILQRLQDVPRSAVITNRSLEDFLVKVNVPMRGPLQNHIQGAYQPLFTLNDFTFFVPRGSTATPFGKVELRGKVEAEADGSQPILLRTNLVLDGLPDSIRLEDSSYPWRVWQDYSGRQARMYFEPINSSGKSLGPAVAFPLAHPLRGLFRLTVFSDAMPTTARPRDLMLIVADPTGRVLGEAAF